jgi:biopolymer transport protein ExbD
MARIELDLPEKDEIDMAPMIDMVFLLLIFFMVATKAHQEGAVALDQPIAAHAKIVQEKPDRLTVSILANEQIYLGAELSDIDRVSKRVKELSDELARQNRSLKLYLRADAAVKHGKVKEMMRKCAEAGVSDIIFSAYQD